jgi:hypothetical protein
LSEIVKKGIGKRAFWYANRLSKMSPAEVVYRLHHKIKQYLDKKFIEDRIEVDISSSKEISRIIPISAFSYEIDDTIKKKVVEQADVLMQNKLTLFRINFDFGKKIDWHLDCKTGNRWSLKFWGDINIRDGFTIGGAKFVWETNRLYGLPILGMAYLFTDNKKYTEKIFGILNDWVLSNPYPRGVNWTSGIEIAIRMANLLTTLSYLDRHTLTKNERLCIEDFVQIHAHHLYRYPSKFSSNNNHAIAEAFGLFAAGVYSPHLSQSKKWLEFGKQVLEREASRQLLPDGGSIECTTTYLSFVADFFLFFILICRNNNIAYEPVVDERLERVCEFINGIMDKNGNISNIGDQDSAVLINFGLSNQENLQSLLNTGAILFQRAEFCRDNFPDMKTKLLFGDKCVRPKQTLCSFGARLFEYSGLAVIRDQFQGKDIVFVGNCMALGLPPLYGHGHLDALSFTLSIEGLDFFVDPGTYLYHSGGKWRSYFRSTAAHNTVRINKKDSVHQISDFMFEKPYTVDKVYWKNDDNSITWEAQHDGYNKDFPYVMHKRRVEYQKECGCFTIADTLQSDNQFHAELFFHLHPDCSAENRKDGILISRDDVHVLLTSDIDADLDIVRGQTDPEMGWYSSEFNHIQETSTIVLMAQLTGTSMIKTKIKIYD